MSRTFEEAAHPLDVALGARVRARRKDLGLSQDELGRAAGVTFQQLQKYEHGINRISFSRLVQIAHALDCSVADLVGPLDKMESTAPEMASLGEPGASELLSAYVNIGSRKHRLAVLNLARKFARDA